MHKQFQKLMNNPGQFKRIKDLSNGSLARDLHNQPVNYKSLPQLPVIYKPVFKVGPTAQVQIQQKIPLKQRAKLTQGQNQPENDDYEYQLRKPRFPMQLEELKFKPNEMLTDPEQSMAFHNKIDSILGQPPQPLSQDKLNLSSKSFNKTREQTLSKASNGSPHESMNQTKDKLIVENYLSKLHLSSPLSKQGSDIPAELVNLINHLQKVKEFQPNQPKVKSKLVERATQHYQNLSETEEVLNELIEQICYEFLQKPTNLQSKDQLYAHIKNLVQKDLKLQNNQLKTGQLVKQTTYDSRTDKNLFEKHNLRNLRGFSDHRGNYITKSGYIIDDYKIDTESQEDQHQPAQKTQIRVEQSGFDSYRAQTAQQLGSKTQQTQATETAINQQQVQQQLDEQPRESDTQPKQECCELNAAQKYLLKKAKLAEKNQVKSNCIHSEAQLAKLNQFETKLLKKQEYLEQVEDKDANIHSSVSQQDLNQDFHAFLNQSKCSSTPFFNPNTSFVLKITDDTKTSNQKQQSRSPRDLKIKVENSAKFNQKIDYNYVLERLIEKSNSVIKQTQHNLSTAMKMVVCSQKQVNHWLKVKIDPIEAQQSHLESCFGLNLNQAIKLEDIQLCESLVVTHQVSDSTLESLLKVFMLQVQGTWFKNKQLKYLKELVKNNKKDTGSNSEKYLFTDSPSKSSVISAMDSYKAKQMDMPTEVAIKQLEVSEPERLLLRQIKLNHLEIGTKSTSFLCNLLRRAREPNAVHSKPIQPTNSPLQSQSRFYEQKLHNRIKDLVVLDLNWSSLQNPKSVHQILDSLIQFAPVQDSSQIPQTDHKSKPTVIQTTSNQDKIDSNQKRESLKNNETKFDFSVAPLSFVKLQRLSLAGLKLQKAPQSFIYFLKHNLPHLSLLDLSYNMFRLNLLPILEVVQHSTCLEHLMLCHTVMPSPKFVALIETLLRNSKQESGLKHLDLSYTQLPSADQIMNCIIERDDINLQTIVLDGIVSAEQIRAIHNAIHQKHSREHNHDFEGESHQNYTLMGQQQYQQDFVQPDEYNQSSKDNITMSDQSISPKKSKFKVVLNSFNSREVCEVVDSSSPLKYLQKMCAFPQSLVFVNRKETKELMFHDRLANSDEFEDEFDTVGKLFDDTFENPDFVYRMWKQSQDSFLSSQRCRYCLFIYRKGQELPNLKLPGKGLLNKQNNAKAKKRADVSQIVFELCPVDLPQLSICYSANKSTHDLQSEQPAASQKNYSKKVIMMPLLIMAELLGIYIDVPDIKLDNQCAWLSNFLLEVMKRKQEQWAEISGDPTEQDTFGQVFWMGSTKNMDQNVNPQLEIQRWFMAAVYISDDMQTATVQD